MYRLLVAQFDPVAGHLPELLEAAADQLLLHRFTVTVKTGTVSSNDEAVSGVHRFYVTNQPGLSDRLISGRPLLSYVVPHTKSQ